VLEPVFMFFDLMGLLLFSVQLFSMQVESVAILWNFAGSTVSMVLAYILPSACYLSIRREKPMGIRMGAAWGLLILGVVGVIVCTWTSIMSLTSDAAPKAKQA